MPGMPARTSAAPGRDRDLVRPGGRREAGGRRGGRPGNSVARDIKLAELLIARRTAPDPAALADPGVALRSVLRSPVAG